jgi:DNA-binding MarR family transcriptional regulator
VTAEPDERLHPRHRLDDAFATPLRFSLMAALRVDTEIDFATLRGALEADDSPLSKAIAALTDAGYVTARKGYAARRPRTWVRATRRGVAAFEGHLAALREIAAGFAPGGEP